MADRKTVSALTKTPVTIQPFSVATLDFIDSKPNYFRVQNSGESVIYCATSGYPTTKDYDFLVKPAGLMSYAEPFKQSKLYIFNPSGTAVNAVVVSFYAEFDPLVLALGQIEIEVPEVMTAATSIESFKASLPAGTNNIGKVQVSNMPTDYAKAANQKDYTESFTELLANRTGNNVVNLYDIVNAIQETFKAYNKFYSGTATSEGRSFNATGGYRLCEIAFFSNDGDGEIVIKTVDTDGSTNSLTVKPGEVVNHIKCRCPTIQVTGTGDYRLALIERLA